MTWKLEKKQAFSFVQIFVIFFSERAIKVIQKLHEWVFINSWIHKQSVVSYCEVNSFGGSFVSFITGLQLQ